MQSHEIPNDQWVPFFNDLSKRHHGEHVSIELVGKQVGDQMEAQDQELMGITVDPPTGICKVEVMVGNIGGVNIAHEVSHPIHVRLAQSDDGKDACVQIEDDDGPSTLVRFLTREQGQAS
jgi:hypothetical protein